MRKRFEQQYSLGQVAIAEVKITTKCRDSIVELLAALQQLFVTEEFNTQIFNILESSILKGKKKTGRTGMDLWQIFVLAQVRLCMNISYDRLHYLSNHDKLLRQIMGVERESGYGQIEFEYQNIYDNVSLLDDQTVRQLNEIVLDFGHDVFKKKEAEALRLKTDSFVIESRVHFPTDYNLLWDCARKCIDVIEKFSEKYVQLTGWRKIGNWKSELKGLMREMGKANSSGGRNKEERVKASALKYLNKSKALILKIEKQKCELPINDHFDLAWVCAMEHYLELATKHIDLIQRRVMQGEKIPHSEKMFSVFEDYTEWITKGKLSPNVELGKKLGITTDQYDLIVDYQIMDHEQDRDVVIELADRVLPKYPIYSWSFDKGYWNKENKALLETEIAHVIMPKLGKRTQLETEQEHAPIYKRLRNKHSAIESNINELENRGLDHCPNYGYAHFKSYVGLGVCAYNLKKIGKAILEEKRKQIKAAANYRKAA
jgi:putative sterol carrier protein